MSSADQGAGLDPCSESSTGSIVAALASAGFPDVEVTPFGYKQSCKYTHPDLCDEYLFDLDSPFATTVASGVGVYSFVVLGDQNAGKSTFLHAWANAQGRSFLRLTSWLPFLTASFVNTRVLSPATPAPGLAPFSEVFAGVVAPGDEPPFLDTDLGRASVLVTLDTFAFFVDEFRLDPALLSTLGPDVRYVALQFIEVGGDHLDRIMMPDAQLGLADEEGLAHVVAASRSLVASARSAAYFVNGDVWAANPDEAWSCLSARLTYLNELYAAEPDPLALSLYVTRLPLDTELAQAQCKALYARLAAELLPSLPFLSVVSVSVAAHLDADGAIDANHIMLTLSRLFQSGVHTGSDDSSSASSLAGVTACALANAFKDAVRVGDDPGALDVFLTAAAFEDWLEDQPVPELPPPLLLQSFGPVLDRLASSAHAALLHYSHGFSDIGLVLPGVGTWTPPPPPSASRPLAARFPLYAPLMEQIEFLLTRNIPPQFWYAAPETAACPALVRPEAFPSLVDGLAAAIASAIDRVTASAASVASEVDTAHHARLLVMLIEEWALLFHHAPPTTATNATTTTTTPAIPVADPAALTALATALALIGNIAPSSATSATPTTPVVTFSADCEEHAAAAATTVNGTQ